MNISFIPATGMGTIHKPFLLKLLFGLSVFLLAYGNAAAQFYYKDLVSNKQLLADMAAYKNNKVRSIQVKSLESDGSPSEGFVCQKKISKDYRRVELFTRTPMTGASLFTSEFDKEGRLLSTHDSSDLSVTAISYNYDNKNRIAIITSSMRSHDDDFRTEVVEEHIYTYNDQDQPLKMLRVKNRYDTTEILFANDENNNVAIEKDTRSGSKYYYYYDAKKRLTDVVQANDVTTKLLPDYLFEYNAAGQVTQMTSTESGSNDYYIWKYTYDNGLRIREKCYNKARRLVGSIEYEYK